MHRTIKLFFFITFLPLLSCGVGVNGNGSGSGGAPTFKRIFVTSTLFTSNLSGLTGADSTCTTIADNAGLGGTWKAWLSTSGAGNGAISRINDVGPWYLVDETTEIFANRAAMANSNPLNPINEDQTGAITSQTQYWTGTTAAGGVTLNTCSNWTGITNGLPIGSGTVGAVTGSLWTNNGTNPTCGSSEALLCIEQ